MHLMVHVLNLLHLFTKRTHTCLFSAVQISDSFPIYNQYNNDMTNREDETSQSPIGYVVSKIRRTDSALEEETVISDWIGMSGAGDYLGIKRPDDMGYTLHLISFMMLKLYFVLVSCKEVFPLKI